MKYIEFKDALKEFTLFSVKDIRKIEPGFDKRRLSEWSDKNYIRKIIRGYYIFSDLALDENVLFEIANKIYSPSYVSLQVALSRYHLIPESVYEITSVTTRTTQLFKTPTASFSYRSIKPHLFFGYELVDYNQKTYKLAEVEKAILDYLYYNPSLKLEHDFESIRIDADSFHEQVKEDKLRSYLSQYKQKAFEKRVGDFLRFMSNA